MRLRVASMWWPSITAPISPPNTRPMMSPPANVIVGSFFMLVGGDYFWLIALPRHFSSLLAVGEKEKGFFTLYNCV